jgi:hypothetical protein
MAGATTSLFKTKLVSESQPHRGLYFTLTLEHAYHMLCILVPLLLPYILGRVANSHSFDSLCCPGYLCAQEVVCFYTSKGLPRTLSNRLDRKVTVLHCTIVQHKEHKMNTNTSNVMHKQQVIVW